MRAGRLLLLLVSALWLAALAVPCVAQTVAMHGIGNWVYTLTDENPMLGGDEQGRFDRCEFGLNASANPQPNLSIQGQLFVRLGGQEAEVEPELDFGFAEWSFSDALRLQIGKIKQPFGIYSEIFDLGTVRPFFDLPQAIYGPVGMATEGFTGAGIRGLVSRGGWELDYNLYFGEVEAAMSQPWADVVILHDMEEGEIDVQNAFGGRLVAATPVEGLSFGVSAYSGVKDKEAEDEHSERSTVYGIQAEYLAGPVTARAEYAAMDYGDILGHSGWYAEGGYMVTKNLQLAARYDWAETSLDEVDLGEDADLLNHSSWAMGANWWFSNNFVVKLSYTAIDGLRLLEEGDQVGGAEGAKETTSVFQFGGQFTF